jgi:hypothetical protein
MEAVLHHETVVEAVRQRGPALPVRFGTVFRDATAVASALSEQYESLAADLRRLGDKIEVGLTALWTTPSHGEGEAPAAESRVTGAPTSGARYLRTLAAELRDSEALKARAARVAHELDCALGRLALEGRVSLVPTPRIAVRMAYLLEPSVMGAFRAAFEASRRDQGELRLVLTGPWPPYSFVRRGPRDGGHFGALAQLLTDVMEERAG